MTTSTPQLAPSKRPLDAFIAFVAIVAVVTSTVVFALERHHGNGSVNWILFGAIGFLLVVTEATPSAALRFGSEGLVTPSWAFAFALLLLGSPASAIAVMAFASMISDIASKRGIDRLVFNAAQVSTSLAFGSLTLFAFGVHGPIFDPIRLSLHDGIAMILSGVVVFLTNGIIIGLLLTFLERKRFMAIARQGLMLSMTADASMLAIAPVLVVSVQVSPLMVPLLGTTALLVFLTARQALHRAHDADHDPLTQLLNRRAFLGALEEFAASSTHENGAAIFILDLDKFKEVNDRLGHRVGDHVLQQFATRLTAALPGGAVVARLGGDEFAVLVRGASADEAGAIASRVHASFGDPLQVDGFPLSAASSIGVAMFPEHGSTPGEVLHAADVAMYRAKRYRSGVEVFESFGTAREHGRVSLLADVAGAIEQQQFELLYQPQIDMRTGTLDAVEALLRWEHPIHGTIAPGEFIGLAEQTDLIGPLTSYILERALRDLPELPDTCRLALNISARNLQDRHFARETLDVLDAAGVAPSRIELEITESAIADDPELARLAVEEFRAAGVSVTIDDFGTGYASFAMLRDFHVDRIKIDRSFITSAQTSERNTEIIGSIVDLAHRLGLEVTAEGVECIDIWNLLTDFGCDLAQGFLVSRPVAINEIRALAAETWFATEPIASTGLAS